MSEYIDWDMVFIVGDETYIDCSVVQTATINISAAYGQWQHNGERKVEVSE